MLIRLPNEKQCQGNQMIVGFPGLVLLGIDVWKLQKDIRKVKLERVLHVSVLTILTNIYQL